MGSKPKVKIENWVMFRQQLHGDVYGHPRFKDGTSVVTSKIVDGPDEPQPGDIVETLNTLYELGNLTPNKSTSPKTISEAFDQVRLKDLPCDKHETMDSCPVIELKAHLERIMEDVIGKKREYGPYDIPVVVEQIKSENRIIDDQCQRLKERL